MTKAREYRGLAVSPQAWYKASIKHTKKPAGPMVWRAFSERRSVSTYASALSAFDRRENLRDAVLR